MEQIKYHQAHQTPYITVLCTENGQDTHCIEAVDQMNTLGWFNLLNYNDYIDVD